MQMPMLGSAAPSSSRITASSEAIGRDALIGYCRELFEPERPRQKPTAPVVVDAA
jgi:hypothetical protein